LQHYAGSMNRGFKDTQEQYHAVQRRIEALKAAQDT
jgi:hypothetical protein